MSGPEVKRRALPRFESDEAREDRTSSQLASLLQ